MKGLARILMAFVLSLFLAGAAFATADLDFGTGDAGAAGTITAIPGGFMGSGIAIDSFTVAGDPGFNGVYDVMGLVNGSGEKFVGALSFNTVTGAFSIVGNIPSLGIVGPNALTPATLVTGTSMTSSGVFGGDPVLEVFLEGTDIKNPLLLAALGLGDNPYVYIGFSGGIEATGITGGPWTVNSTDFHNTAVPEPGILILLGMGLSAVGLLSRRIKF